ncbi:uncharacterized protein LOC127565570 [Drosophila albomicans]|uniref:Uncharacterized protein LOC127565570 n=1 Tax=Drosophila albomicans TaxID=7291 RepID=A0A9C6WAH6_DROAB|nr:uncharacterized protein LOC127565570 [Drosophila albomicans]
MFFHGLFLLLSIFVAHDEAAKPPFTIEFLNFSCALRDPNWVLQLDCKLHRKRIYPSISVAFKLAKQVNEFNLLYHLQLVKKDNSKKTVGRLKLDGCKFLESFYSNNMVGKFFKRIQSVSNLPKKCPIPGNKLLEIRNYTVLPEEYPPFAPAATFHMTLQIERNGNIVADIINEGSISY